MPIKGFILVLAVSVSLSVCSTELETSGVPTFFDPKYHDDGRDSEPVVAQYTPLESIQSPAYTTFTQLVDSLGPTDAERYNNYPVQQITTSNQSAGQSATITKSQSDIYFSDSYSQSRNNGAQNSEAYRPIDSKNYNQLNSQVSVQSSGNNNGAIVKLESLGESHSPNKDNTYKSIPLLDASDVVPKTTPATYRANSFEAPASTATDQQEAYNNAPQQYYPGAGWQAVSPQPSPTPAQVHSYFQSPGQSFSYSSGQAGDDTSNWKWPSPAVTTQSAFQVGFAPVQQTNPTSSSFQEEVYQGEQLKSTQSSFQAGFAPVEQTRTIPTAFQAGFRPLSPSSAPTFRPIENLASSPLTPSVPQRPLSSFYSSGGTGGSNVGYSQEIESDADVHKVPYEEYGKPVKTISVSEEEYKHYLSAQNPIATGFSNPYESSPSYSPAYSYGLVEEAKPYSRPVSSSPYYKPKDTMYKAHMYFAKNNPYASGYGMLKSSAKGEWDWKAQSYGTPHDLVSKGPYKVPKTQPYKTRGNGWSPGTPTITPMKGYNYKYSTMHHPGTVKGNYPTTPDEMENGPGEEFKEEELEEELDNLDIYDCENRHRCSKPKEEDDISEQVDLTRKKPRANKFLRNDLFKRLIKNIAFKTKRRPRRPPPPPPPRHLRKKPVKCKGRRCRRPDRHSTKGEKSHKTINIVIKN